MKILPQAQTRLRGLFLLLLTGSVLAACAAAPAYQTPQPEAPAAFEGAAATTAKTADPHWWANFRDPALNQLVAFGLAQNLDVRMAVERITEAQANAGLAASGELPQLSASAQGGRSDPTGASVLTAGSATANVSWMIDLFGRNASARAASGARLDAAYASTDVARIAMTGAVAEAYVDLRYFQGRIALTRESKVSRQKTADLIRSAYAAGSATKLDTLRADQLIAIADAQLPALEVGYAQSLLF